MVDAYLYAEGASTDGRGVRSPEVIDLGYIEQFGVEAVYGRRILSYGEINRMVIARNVYDAYRSRKAAAAHEGGWAKWAAEHPQTDEMLKRIELLIHADD